MIIFGLEGGVFMSNIYQENPVDLNSLLPKEILGWMAAGEDEYYVPETIFDYIDGAGEVFRAYNFQRLLARRYKKEGKPDLIVDLFDMGSSKDAFGVFTHDLEGENLGIGRGSTYKGGLLSFWKDRIFASLYAEEETEETRAAVLALGRQIASAVAREGELPSILGFLPEEIRSGEDIRYFHNHLILNYHFFVADENILLLDQQTEAVLAGAGEKGEKNYILCIRYLNDLNASRALESFVRAYMPDAHEPGLVQTEDGKWTAARSLRHFVFIVFNASSASAAKGIMDRVEHRVEQKMKGSKKLD